MDTSTCCREPAARPAARAGGEAVTSSSARGSAPRRRDWAPDDAVPGACAATPADVDRSGAGVRWRPAVSAACHPRRRARPPVTTKHNHQHRLLSYHRVYTYMDSMIGSCATLRQPVSNKILMEIRVTLLWFETVDSMYVVYIIISDISLKTRCFGLHFCRSKFRYIFNHFYVMRPESRRVRRKNAKCRPFRRSRSFKVTDFCTNRKLIYDFLLVINTNGPPILHRFGNIYSIPNVKNRYICIPLCV